MKSITYKCDVCNKEWIVSYSYDTSLPDTHKSCPYCEHDYLVDLFTESSDDFREEVEKLIYERKILEGMRLIKQTLRIGLGQSNQLFSWRYRQLRDINQKNFICSDEAYWNGFYS